MCPDAIVRGRVFAIRAMGCRGMSRLRIGLARLSLLLLVVSGGCNGPVLPPWTKSQADPIDVLTVTAAGPNTGGSYPQVLRGVGLALTHSIRTRLRITPLRINLAQSTDSQFVRAQIQRQKLSPDGATPRLVIYQTDLGLTPLSILRQTIGDTIPVVFAAGFDGPEQEERFRALDALPNTTGVIRGDQAAAMIMNIRQLFPATKEIVTISPGGPQAIFSMARVAERFPELRLSHLTVSTDERLAEVLDSLPSTSALVVLNAAQNVKTAMRLTPDGLPEALQPPSRVPIFAFTLNEFDESVVGGPMSNGQAFGRMIGEQVLALLSGADADTLPVRLYEKWEVRYNWNQLVRFGIPVSALPANATIVGRTNAIWRDYRAFILVVLALFASFALFLLLSLRRTAKVQRMLRINQIQAQERTRAQDAERLRIARDLHDSIGQGLSLMALRLDRMQIAGGPPVHSEEARSLLLELRSIVGNLHPVALHQQPLQDAIRQLLAEVDRTAGIATALIVSEECLPDWQRLSEVEATAILRVIQESVRNVLTHAQAHRCTVHMDRKADRTLRVRIMDDGIGLPPSGGLASGQGLGLASIRDRAASIGWTATISAGSDQGTMVCIEEGSARVASSVGPLE